MTETELKNAALALIGAKQVSDYSTSTTREAVLLNALYDTFKEKILSLRRWSFATKREMLDDETSVSDDEFSYSFDIPTGFVNLVAVYTDNKYKNIYTQYSINNNLIYAG